MIPLREGKEYICSLHLMLERARILINEGTKVIRSDDDIVV